MSTTIHERVQLANEGRNPCAIIKLKSGWVVMADVQPLDGYCLLLSDPVVTDLNTLDEARRTQYCLDMTRVGDALLNCTNAYRINYETLGNLDPALHTHIMPRYRSEPDEKRTKPVYNSYNYEIARVFDPIKDAAFVKQMQQLLAPYAVGYS